MRLKWTAGILIAAGLLWSAGCGGGDGRTIDASSGAPRQIAPMADLVARARPPIPDLPVPIGFKLDESESLDYALAGARFVNHKYKGKPDKFTVKRFYERQMPINRWTLTTAMFAGGEIMMDFEKETERCRVSISSRSLLNLFRRTHIYVRLWTSGPIQGTGQ